MIKKSGLVISILIMAFVQLPAQLTVSNLLEYQLGNLPDNDETDDSDPFPKDLSTLYDQLNITYRYKNIRLAAKAEQFQTADESTKYARIAQRSIRFKTGELAITVGNFYEIIGRGLLLRSYEIPGTIREDRGFRVRYGFYRDLDGFHIRYNPGFADIKLFRGRPVNIIVPPTVDDEFRRPDLVEGIESVFRIDNSDIGLAYLRNDTNGDLREYGTLFTTAILPLDIQFYGEYAQRLDGGTDLFSISDYDAHALYLSLNMIYGAAGVTLEYKDYNDFFLNFNDPPPLVKEHQYLLLNRSTHSLEPQNESGWQAEFFYTLDQGHGLVANLSRADIETPLKTYVFEEQFLELSYHLNNRTLIKVFADRSRETLLRIEDRYTAGIYSEVALQGGWSVSADLEYQTFKRELFETNDVENLAGIFTVSLAPDLSLGLTVERSDDLNDLPLGEDSGYWLGGSVSYQYRNAHLVSLFYGSRRGGNACTAGICYEVLPFEGLELRINSLL